MMAFLLHIACIGLWICYSFLMFLVFRNYFIKEPNYVKRGILLLVITVGAPICFIYSLMCAFQYWLLDGWSLEDFLE